MTTPNEVKLHKFVPERMLRPDATVLCVGARGSGKTTMMMYLLSCMASRLDLCVTFCPTADTRQEYERVLPKCFVYPEYDPDRLTEIVAAQTTLNKRQAATGAGHGHGGDGSASVSTLRRIGVILDDCMYDKNMLNGPTMRYLLMNGRHDNFFYMNGVQYMMDLNKASRSQIDVAVVFREPNVAYRKALRENLLGIFDTDEQLVRVFDEGLREHEALVFDQRAYRAQKPCLFYCKAPLVLPRFRVGCDAFWLLYYKYFVRQRFGQIDQFIEAAVAAAKGQTAPAALTDAEEGPDEHTADVTDAGALAATRAKIVRGGKVILPICRVGDGDGTGSVSGDAPAAPGAPAAPAAPVAPAAVSHNVSTSHSHVTAAPATVAARARKHPKPATAITAAATTATAPVSTHANQSFGQSLMAFSSFAGNTKKKKKKPSGKDKPKTKKKASKADAAQLLAPLPPLPSITGCAA